jgi:shikimate dehydrogenase
VHGLTPAREAATATRRFAVVGSPIAHSRSPQIFDLLARAANVPLTYGRIDIAPAAFDAAFAAARFAYDGWNVTAPHKAAALAAADAADPAARLVGAANVIAFRDGRASASNTDVAGVRALLQARAIDARGASVTVLGAGGAARATVLALAEAGAARVIVTNRTAARAQELVDALRAAAGATALIAGDPAAESAIVINATSDGGAVADAVEACALDGWCVDLQYAPAATPFVRAARAAGRRAVNGTPMLVAQAMATFRLWYGDVALDEPALTAQLAEIVEAA